MKKLLLVLSLGLMSLAILVLSACGQDKPAASQAIKVGMVTDAGTIDDKSFNQGTWEGIKKAGAEFSLETRYLKPSGTTEADYIKEISNLYDTGFKFIVTPGFKFETTIFQAQNEYKDAWFVLIDGAPHAGDYAYVVGPKTVAIYFAEHESGFLAGVAAALQLTSGKAGFIGGMEIPAVQKFNWGFQQGVAYANSNLGTSLTIAAEDVVYQGTFSDVAAGQQLAAQMYDRDVNVIFAAAGGVGVGVANEAKTRALAGKTVWVVGVDVDQYSDGVYEEGKSIYLTSAMKKIDVASYDMIKSVLNDSFPGGQTLVFNAGNDGVGIPASNPNLAPEVVAKVSEVTAKLKDGSLVVAAEQGGLIK